MKMNIFTIAAAMALTFASGATTAQNAAGSGPAGSALELMQDDNVSAGAEALGRGEKRRLSAIAKFDLNDDGVLSVAERQSMQDARSERLEAKARNVERRAKRQAAVDRFDADKDGSLSLEERAALKAARADRDAQKALKNDRKAERAAVADDRKAVRKAERDERKAAKAEKRQERRARSD